MVSPEFVKVDKVFVAIASYRDKECQWTVRDLFEAAAFPDRIMVGICWQFDALQDTACFLEPYPYPNQVKVINVTLQQTRGACWAKSMALSLVTDEDYVLLIDSHMRFAKGWDAEMINMLKETGNQKGFLSSYPAGYEPPNQRRFNTPRLAPVKFFDRVMSQNSVLLDMSKPIVSYLMAGGYMFCERAMIEQVPYDPHLYFIGEEIAHAARFFTHGWVGYAPHKCLIHHYYTRKTSVKHWEDEKERWSKINAASYKRVRHLLGIERTSDELALVDIEKYCLGTERSLTEFQASIGVNFNAQVIDRKRHETLSAIQDAISNPVPPTATHEMSTLAVNACRSGYYLLPKLDAYIGKSLMEYGEWVEGLNTVFVELFKAGGVAVEVGAGFGAHTIPLARLAGRKGRVIAIEQSRRMVELLYANIALNAVDNVSVVHARLAATEGSAQVSEPIFTSNGNFGVISHQTDIDHKKYPLPVVQMDSQTYTRVDLLFIDTPGEVNDVLIGAKRMISTHKPILILNADNTKDAINVQNTAKQLGYTLWEYSCPFYSETNFFANKKNIFGGLRSHLILAASDSRDLTILSAKLIPAKERQ